MNKQTIMQNFTTENVFTIDAFDLDKIVSEYISHSFEFVAIEEASNDSVYKFCVNGDVNKWDREAVDRLRIGKYVLYSASEVLNVMCSDGLLTPGTYLVEVCW